MATKQSKCNNCFQVADNLPHGSNGLPDDSTHLQCYVTNNGTLTHQKAIDSVGHNFTPFI